MLYFTEKKSECNGCGACTSICPIGCISFVYDEEGFAYPKADSRCVKCRECYNICPIFNNVSNAMNFRQFAVAAQHIDRIMWHKSTSGGAFSAICKVFCDDNDVIFGAKFEDVRVVHDSVIGPDNIDCFRKSKYVQSDLRDSYYKTKAALEGKRKVVFSGTPCQIAGLRSFLGREYDNLLCIDLICHGVGSPSIFERYLSYLQSKYHSKVASYTFRNKKEKMGRFFEYIVAIEFENGTKIEDDSDLFNIGFLQGLFLRPSCYTCKFKNFNRVGDITIGDFKKKHDLLPEVKSLDNLSTIIVNTRKGMEAYKKSVKFLKIYPVEIEDIVQANSPLRYSVSRNIKREDFFKEIQLGVPIEQVLINHIAKTSFLKNVWLLIPDKMRAAIKRRTIWIRK